MKVIQPVSSDGYNEMWDKTEIYIRIMDSNKEIDYNLQSHCSARHEAMLYVHPCNSII